MRASSQHFFKFLGTQDNQFVIPIYQRNYDWGEEQCRQLLEDIIEVGNTSKTHFIGSIVYVCNDEYTTSEIEQFVVIDGQQRITTITLLLMALYHFAEKLGNVQLSCEIREKYLENKFAPNEEFKVKLKATENNDRDIHYLLEGKPIPRGEYSNIKNNYNLFRNYITEDNFNTIYDGFKRLLFVEIKLERDKDNAQKIFESLNSTGLDLSQGDLIRNYILMELEPKEQNRLFQSYWMEIEAHTKIEGKSYTSDFVRDYLTTDMGEIPNQKRVYEVFKRRYPIDDSSVIEPILKDLLKYSSIYQGLINPDCIEDRDIRKEIGYINYIEMNVAYPFLLKIINDYKERIIDKQVLIRILRFVQTFACRRFVLNLGTNALNKIFKTLYRQVIYTDYEESIYRYVMGRSGKSRMPLDNEIESNLRTMDFYNSRSKWKRYVLERMENEGNTEPVNIIANPTITEEHIFPQRPDKQWQQDLSEEDYKEFSLQHLHTIGNITLSGNNGALGNKSFMEKKTMNKNGDEQGYIYSSLWLNRYLRGIDEWDLSKYQKRTDILIARFIKVWELPKVSEVMDIPEQNISEIDDPTNMSIEYAVFFGKKLDGDIYKGIRLYKYIIKELYQLQPQGFIEKFGTLLKLNEDPDTFHRSERLNSTYYYDTTLSYAMMFANLKTILEKLGLSEELTIKLRKRTQGTIARQERNEYVEQKYEIFGRKEHTEVERKDVAESLKARCIKRVENHIGKRLIKKSESVYTSEDEQIGIYLSTSKEYNSPRGLEYRFFINRSNPILDRCKKCYYMLGCNDENAIIQITQNIFDQKSNQMASHTNKNSKRDYSRILLVRRDERLVWILPLPHEHEQDVTDCLL